MTEIVKLKKRLEKFGLSHNQSKIYLFLLRQGNLRISEIARNLKIPRSSVYENLKVLFELGIAEEIVENSFKVIKAYSLGSIKHGLDERIEELKKQTVDLENLEKALAILPGIPSKPPMIIRYYKGQTGARQLFWNTLKAKDTLYVKSEWGRGQYVGIKFYQNFVTESAARNMKEKVLTNATPRILNSIKQHAGTSVSRTEINAIRCVSEELIPIHGDTLIYNNVYAHISLKSETVSGFEIEDQAFVDMQRAIFKTTWDIARPAADIINLT